MRPISSEGGILPKKFLTYTSHYIHHQYCPSALIKPRKPGKFVEKPSVLLARNSMNDLFVQRLNSKAKIPIEGKSKGFCSICCVSKAFRIIVGYVMEPENHSRGNRFALLDVVRSRLSTARVCVLRVSVCHIEGRIVEGPHLTAVVQCCGILERGWDNVGNG